MLKKLCLLRAPTMAKVVGKDITKKTLFNPVQIAKHFQIKLLQSDNNQTIGQKYLTQVLQKRQKIDRYFKNTQIKHFAKVNNELNILQFTKEKISQIFQRMTPEAQNFIDNYFHLCLEIYFSIYKQMKKKNINDVSKAEKDMINQACQSINQFYPLVTKSPQNCLKFLNMASLSIKNPLIILNRYSFNTNIKICVDEMMQMPRNAYAIGQVLDILKNLYGMGIRIIYYEKDYQIFRHFYHIAKQIWPKMGYYQIKVIQVFSRSQCYSIQMLDKAQKILISYQRASSIQYKQFLIILVFLIKFKRITNKNYKKYSDIIVKLLNKMPKYQESNFYQNTFRIFYYTRIWIPQYWIKFFQQILKQNFVNNDNFYHLYVLSRLIEVDKQNIPESIIKQSTKTLVKVIQKRPDFGQRQIHTNFNTKQNGYQSLGCQTQIANSLRLLNLGIVRVEQMIDIFMVDIIITNQFIIEVNGGVHYNYNLQPKGLYKQPNIKTQFRTWYLQKLGYKVIDVDLQVYNQGSFQIISSLYDIYNKHSGKNDITSFSLPAIA